MYYSAETILQKAVERYHRDEERIRRNVNLEDTVEGKVDTRAQEVRLTVPEGDTVIYSFKLTSRGYLRFRPVW